MTTQDPDENVDKIQIPRCVEDEIKDNADKSMYTETVSMFNDQMLAYFELKINKRGKITKNGKYVSIKNLKKMIDEYNKDHTIKEIEICDNVEVVEDYESVSFDEYAKEVKSKVINNNVEDDDMSEY